MQKVQLYIEGQRIDFFEDENISVKKTIQDIKDPSKIFTDFSKTFNVPASKTNNKIFKHFYNFDIANGFDSRSKKSAEIKINFVSFSKGFIKLEGVKLKDNAPYSYNIIFFGETVLLKDTLGENKLNVLNWLNNFNVDYSSTRVKSVLQNGRDVSVDGTTYTDALVVPLITHTTKLYYDSTMGHFHGDVPDGNLKYDSGSGHNHGVLWSDLKYSIRLHLIILAIQEEYPNIIFSDDFFNISNSAYHNLYMWMHRKKGDVQNSLSGAQYYSKLVSGFPYSLGDYYLMNDSYLQVFSEVPSFTCTITLTPSTASIYNVYVKKSGTILKSELNKSGTYSFDFETGLNDSGAAFFIIVESLATMTFTTIEWDFLDQDFTTTSQTIPLVLDFLPTEQLPEIKIIDFLKGLFNMFNLTAYVSNETIKIDTLDNFYSTYNEYDVSKYVDIEASNVDSALPYKQIDFIYDDYNTYFASIFNQINNQEFGELKYTGLEDGNWVGDIYKISLPFQKMLYERMTDINGNASTNIQWGWMVDDNQEPYIKKPLIHYVNRQSGGNTISFRDNEDDHSGISIFYIPLNSNGIDASGQSLNFKVQIDEYALVENENTLFQNYYFNYISDVFKTKKRLTKLTAYLPLKILLNYTLMDRFIINGNIYKINSINSNLQTGKSALELINE